MRGNHLVREMRKRAGLTQRELAERTGTTQSAIARLERGIGHPTLSRLSAIAEACDLELQVRLVDADDHDWSLIDKHALEDPERRLRNAKRAVAFLRAGRAAVIEAQEEAAR